MVLCKIMLGMQPVRAPALVSEMERVSADSGGLGLMALLLALVKMMIFRIQMILGARITTVVCCGVVLGEVPVETTRHA